MVLDWNAYIEVARQAVAEGVVLLKNDKNVLPLNHNDRVACFGRLQNYYYKSGTGSGGMVNVTKITNIIEGLQEAGVKLDEKLLTLYKDYDLEHPYNKGFGFGREPWSQEEMPIADETVSEFSKNNDVAIFIIGRTAGEEQDNQVSGGAYLLSETEIDALKKVRAHFEKMVVLLNVGGIMDMQELSKINPDAIMYVWQGGMVGGLGISDVLTGVVSPSGKLPDTISFSYKDQPAFSNFGSVVENVYAEDIYVGYRYFETFAKDKVMYPFGFGLSYTTFSIINSEFSTNTCEKTGAKRILGSVTVKNTGNYSGKEVVQIYLSAPQGKLGKPSRVLIAYKKTKNLMPGEEETLSFRVNPYTYASYDEVGLSGFDHSYVIENGSYDIYAGTDVKSAKKVFSFEEEKTLCIEKLSEAMAPRKAFDRIKPVVSENGEIALGYEKTPLATKNNDTDRETLDFTCVPFTGDRGIKLKDVRDKKADMDDFLAQLSDEALACLVRGEGMGSPKVTPGTAAAFGGVSDELKAFGIPCGCCSDGPSGMRLDSGAKAFSLPNGTLLASTFNDELNENLYYLLGLEMTANKVDVLLGPGMNIHRYVLNGRNFEYFSEDPLLTGKMAAAQIRGIKKGGTTGTLKHFCGNNQEKNRHGADSIISERALREIYLKGFEIAVREGNANSIMTTYGPVNGTWTSSRFDLNTKILREEWNFNGIVMTDWWAKIGDVFTKAVNNDYARMIRSQNDLYMVCPDGAKNDNHDNTISSLKDGTLKRAELLRSAKNICSFLMNTNAMKRFCNEPIDIKIINRSSEDEKLELDNVTYFKVDSDQVVIPFNADTVQGESCIYAFDVSKFGLYDFEIVASSDLSELAQTPVTCYFQGLLGGVFTWNGTGGKDVSKGKLLLLSGKYSVARMFYGGTGLHIKEIRLTYVRPMTPEDFGKTDFMIG